MARRSRKNLRQYLSRRLIFGLAGLAVLLECFARFVVRGHGTPAPVAPPTHLVVSGFYRHVRNPMYLALVAIVVIAVMRLLGPKIGNTFSTINSSLPN